MQINFRVGEIFLSSERNTDQRKIMYPTVLKLCQSQLILEKLLVFSKPFYISYMKPVCRRLYLLPFSAWSKEIGDVCTPATYMMPLKETINIFSQQSRGELARYLTIFQWRHIIVVLKIPGKKIPNQITCNSTVELRFLEPSISQKARFHEPKVVSLRTCFHCNFTPDISKFPISRTNCRFQWRFEKSKFHCSFLFSFLSRSLLLSFSIAINSVRLVVEFSRFGRETCNVLTWIFFFFAIQIHLEYIIW